MTLNSPDYDFQSSEPGGPFVSGDSITPNTPQDGESLQQNLMTTDSFYDSLRNNEDVRDIDLHNIVSSDLLALTAEVSNFDELFKETPDLKVEYIDILACDSFPNLSEHDNANIGFELNLNPNITGKNNWFYSPKLKKVFIKLDKTFYIEAVHGPTRSSQLFLRAMMVFVEDIGEPVIRCANHMCSDRESNSIIKNSVIRSENPKAVYQGSVEGKTIKERLSVLIPLNQGKPDECNIFRHSIALKFVCQNSCIGRKPTSIIFTLEDERCAILSKKIISVKVCSCPKRDKEKDENKETDETKRKDLKRPLSDSEHPPSKRPSFLIKEEPVEDSNDDGNTSETEVTMTITMPDIKSMKHVMTCAFDHIAGLMATTPNLKYAKYFKSLKKSLGQLNGQR